ncbi:MAG: DMT family transporter [Eubacteriales bacterium]|nr:DMT family transporter [Eubacteriales bacterium]
MPIKNALSLFLCAFIWGTAFVAQSVGMDYMGPLTFNGIRFLMGALVLLPVVAVRRNAAKRRIARGDSRVPSYSVKRTIASGAVVGAVLFSASTLQQLALQTADVGKAGFITAMYIVIVPAAAFFMTRKFFPRVWLCVLIAIAGLYFLCVSKEAATVLTGADILLLLCSCLFAGHIVCVDKLGAAVDGIELSFVQFVMAGLIGTILALFLEQPTGAELAAGMVPLLYAGVMSSGVAYTLQIVGQKGADPTIASLIMSLESVISVLAGWALLGQTLSGRELFGCALMFAAIVIVQLPGKEKKSAFS